MLSGVLEKWPNYLFASSCPFHALLDLCKTSNSGVKHSDKTGETDLQIFCPYHMEEKEACISASAPSVFLFWQDLHGEDKVEFLFCFPPEQD